MEFLLILLIIGLICGAITAAIASSKGRSVAAWFFGGFVLGFLSLIFGIIMIIIVACLPNLNAQRAYRRQVEQSNRRLREQLRQERLKGDAFRQHSMARLDAHDQSIGVDTRSLGSVLGCDPRAQLASDRPEGALGQLAGDTQEPQAVRVGQPGGDGQAGQFPQGQDELSWYFADAGQSFGPVPAGQILDMLRQRSLQPDSLIWAEGMLDWQPAREVPIFRDAVNQ